MKRRTWAAIVIPAVALAGAGGYAAADAADVVPGWITSEPAPSVPASFFAARDVSPATVEGPVASLDSEAPMPSPAVVQALAEALRRDSRTGSSTGISVVDIATGTVLADVRADDPQVPASNTKSLTAAAVLLALGPDATLTTSVTWAGDASGTSVPRITLVAGGDMLLSAGAGHGNAVLGADGYAGLADLADEAAESLAAAGVTRVALAVDDLAFEGPPVNPGWPWYAVSGGFVAPATGLAVDVGSLTDERYPPRHPDPSIQAAEAFAARLEERGIVVASIARLAAPASDVRLASVESAPLWAVLRHMLLESDNTVAEDLVMVLALESGRDGTVASGTDEVVVRLAAAGLDTTGVNLDDGSGFRASNRIPPRFMTDLVVLAAGDPQLDDMLEWYPIAALRGTLHERFIDSDAAGLVRAKTGSLSGVTSLSGTVITADGRWLAFSVLADSMPTGQERPRTAIDEFLASLAACGCG